jgi:two-component system sensor histidine kinase UhpB
MTIRPLRENVGDPGGWLGRALVPLAAAAGYYAGAVLGFALTFSPNPVATLWPPNAILLAALVLTPRSRWPTIVGATLAAHLLVEIQSGVPLAMVLAWFASNAVQAVLGAAWVRAVDDPVRLDSLGSLSAFVGLAVLLAPFAASFLDAGLVTLIGWGDAPFWTVWRLRFLSNAVATLTLVPLIVVLCRRGVDAIRRAPPARLAEAALLLLGLVVVGILAVVTDHTAELPRIPAFLYAPLPLLLWAAARFGLGGVSTGLLVLTLLSIVAAARGHGAFVTMSTEDNVLALQMFVVVISVPLMLLAVLLEERRQAEQELRRHRLDLQSSRDRIRELVARLLDVQEDDRRRLARELHDGVNQSVAALAIAASVAHRRLPETAGESRKALRRMRDQATRLADDVRRLSHELHPQVLLHAGLVAGLRSCCEEFSAAAGFDITFQADDERIAVPAATALCLYRVTQEALHNVARHAGVQQARVALRRQRDEVELAVEDAGIGFRHPAGPRAAPGLGLLGIEERVRLVQGRVDIFTAPARGTRLRVRVPVNGDAGVPTPVEH